MHSNIQCIAHRGASSSHPENTLAAVIQAVKCGSDMIELDVHCTRDGEVVTIHDSTVNRTTNGTGKVCDWTLEDLKKLDAGSWFSPTFHQERIPTLHEIIEVLKPTPTQFCIEIKGQNLAEAERIVSRTLDVLETHNLIDRSIITSFTPEILIQSKQRHPQLPTALDPDDQVAFSATELQMQLQNARGNIILQRHSWLSPLLVESLHALGIPVWAWTVNEVTDMHTMINLNVDGIMTDDPARLMQALSPPNP